MCVFLMRLRLRWSSISSLSFCDKRQILLQRLPWCPLMFGVLEGLRRGLFMFIPFQRKNMLILWNGSWCVFDHIWSLKLASTWRRFVALRLQTLQETRVHSLRSVCWVLQFSDGIHTTWFSQIWLSYTTHSPDCALSLHPFEIGQHFATLCI